MKQNELIDKIHKTIHKTSKKYNKWSNGLTLADNGVESFIVSELAKAIMNMDKPPAYLTLETTLADIFYYQGKRPKGRAPNSLNRQKRLDITLYNKREFVTYAVEVKRKWSQNKCYEDIEELCSLMQKYSRKAGGSFVAGIFVLLLKQKQRTIKKYISKLNDILEAKKKKCHIRKYTFFLSKPDNLGFSSLCLVIK